MTDIQEIDIAIKVLETQAKVYNEMLSKLPKRLRAASKTYNKTASLLESIVILQEVQKEILIKTN